MTCASGGSREGGIGKAGGNAYFCKLNTMKVKMKKLLALIAAMLPCFWGMAQQPQQDLDAEYAGTLLKAGTEAPEITLQDIRGKEVSLSQFRGRKVVLLFWASWCPDCRAEIPELKALHAAAQPDKVAFVSVSFDRSFETLCQFVEENYLPGVQLFDPAGKKESKVGEQYGVKWIPSLYVIDEEGKVQLGTVVLDKVTAALKASNVLARKAAGEQAGQGLARQGRELCTDENCAL